MDWNKAARLTEPAWFSASLWVYSVLVGLQGLSWVRSSSWLWIIKTRTLMNDYRINTSSSGNKTFVNMSPCGTNKLDAVKTCLLSFKLPDRGKKWNILADKWIDSVAGFFVFALILLLSCSLRGAKAPEFPFLEQNNHKRKWRRRMWLFLPRKTQAVPSVEITEQ